MRRIGLLMGLLLAWLGGCRRPAEKPPTLGGETINALTSQMTEVMVHDVTNPPLAARFFAYACLAGYEVLARNDRAYAPLHRVLNAYPNLQKPKAPEGHSLELSALLAMLETAKKLQPSGALLMPYETHLLDSCRTVGFSDAVIDSSRAYAQAVSKQILAYAKADGYRRISNYPRYTPSPKEGSWYPTPPGFFAPVEPYFNTVRPFTLDTCSQFKPLPPVPFSSAKNSAFYALMQQNYAEKLPEEHGHIAAFWDCNPFALDNNGHLAVGVKKFSPGAHWMGITGIACRMNRVNFAKALKIHTVVAVGLMDTFICCWDEKYRSNRIRPETAIRKYIDPSWKPFLQTPPFPEYLSGHSTISACSAVILTHFFGKNFAYTDTVERRYGVADRRFGSFQQAAMEAGISRFYGGIHFLDAIENGRTQGLKVGEWVLAKMERTTTRPAKK